MQEIPVERLPAEGKRTRLSAVRLDWLLFPALIFAASRLLILAFGVVGDAFLPTDPGHWIADPSSPFLSLWAKWDSQWYLQIVRDGYWYQPLRQSNVAFFPMYPLTVQLLTPLAGGNPVLAGFLVSNAALLAALVVLYRLAELELASADAARRTVAYLAFFPTAFFFSCVYTESLFLLFSVSCIYFARRRSWPAAAVAGLLASATRNLGVVLVLLAGWEWLRSLGWQLNGVRRSEMWQRVWQGVKAHWPQVLLLGAIPLGLILYMAFLKFNFDRPLAFVEAQAAWGRRQIGPVAVLARELKSLADFQLNQGHLSRLLNLGAVFAVLGMVPFIWRRLGEGYALYVLILILVPISSSAMSVIRYVLTLFPVFIVLGDWGRRSAVDRVLLASFAGGLGVLTAIFVNWIFVA